MGRAAIAACVAIVVACAGPSQQGGTTPTPSAGATSAQSGAIASGATTASTPPATGATPSGTSAPPTPTASAARTPDASGSAIATGSAPASTASTSPSGTASASPAATITPTTTPGTSPAAAPTQPLAVIPIVTRPNGARGLALFNKPFAGEYALANFHDHDVPQLFVDANGSVLTYWGERLPALTSLDGHDGFDWPMPEGTPLLAVAGGRVIQAGQEAPFACPLLDSRSVSGNSVYVEHRVVGPDGEPLVLWSRYSHLSRVDVAAGQSIDAGARIGLSGSTGCSTGPHLHFEVYRVDPVSGRRSPVDPYGWEGSGADPWAANSAGAPSIWLWANAPSLYKEMRQAPNVPQGNGSATITTARWMGYRDDVNPNNEWVEITLDIRYAPSGVVPMTGFQLLNNKGDSYTFPQGFTLRRDRAVYVHTGAGQNTETDLYWGRSSGVWDNAGDCLRLIYPSGGVYTIRTANVTCPART